jgi:hypothetical protein
MHDSLLGADLGSCRLESLITQDDCDLVFRARHQRLGRETVIRVLRPTVAVREVEQGLAE